MADYYELLGVARGASSEEIKRQFRKLARQTHPDANPGDPEAEARFREIAEAYEVLSDPERRARYDRGDTIDLADLFSTFGGLDDLLRGFFGETTFGTARPKGRDVLVNDRITLTEAAFGTAKEMTFHTAIVCETCAGSGLADGAQPIRCRQCDGQGAVRVARQSLLGSVMSVATCDRCGGTGSEVDDPCPTCAAHGAVEGDRKVTVDIPPGITDGARLRLSGEGAAGRRGSPPGDLYVQIDIESDPRFIRQGDDLVHHVSIGVAAATLGLEVPVPLLGEGEELLRIEPGVQPGSVFRLPRQGMGRLRRRGRGDLLIKVDVEVPANLSREEEEAMRSFGELRGEDVSPSRRWRRAR